MDAIACPLFLQLLEPYQYLTYQQALAYDVADALRELARDSVCHALISTFLPMQTNMSAAAVASPPLLGAPGGLIPILSNATSEMSDSALRRQLIRFNLMLRSNLLSFVMDSARQWRQYMLRAMKKTVDPVLQRGAAVAPAEDGASGFQEKCAVPPLLQLSIVLSGGSAVFHPPANKLEAILRQVLETMIHAVGTINKLGQLLSPQMLHYPTAKIGPCRAEPESMRQNYERFGGTTPETDKRVSTFSIELLLKCVARD